MTARRIAGLIAGIAVLTASSAFAESAAGVRIPFEYRSWTLRDVDGVETTLDQTYGGIVSTVTFSSSASVVLSTAGATSRREIGATRDALDGLSDLRGEFYLHLLRDRALLLVGGRAPTGTTALTEEELRTAEALGNPLLGTRLREYGRGPGVNAGLALSLPLGRGLQLGLGAGALLPGTFTLIAGSGDFRPTPELSASAGLDFQGRNEREESRALSLRATWRTYAKDKLDGVAVFEEGDQLELGADASADIGTVRASLGAQLTTKNDNVALVSDGGDVAAVKARAGTGLGARATVTTRVSRALRVGASGDWRHFDNADVAAYNGDAWGAGPLVQLLPTPAFLVSLGATVQGGSAGDGDSALDLSGFTVATTIVWRPFR